MSSISTEPTGMSYFNMPQEQIKEVDKRMQPDGWSEAGFLKMGQSGKKVSELDRETLKKRGVTYEQIAEKLEEIGKIAGKHTLGQPEHEEFHFKLLCTRGHQTCPFSFEKVTIPGWGDDVKDCANSIGSWDVTVTRKKTGEKLFFSGLHAHLIRKHRFFEDGEYRLDPDKACDFFGIGKK